MIASKRPPLTGVTCSLQRYQPSRERISRTLRVKTLALLDTKRKWRQRRQMRLRLLLLLPCRCHLCLPCKVVAQCQKRTSLSRSSNRLKFNQGQFKSVYHQMVKSSLLASSRSLRSLRQTVNRPQWQGLHRLGWRNKWQRNAYKQLILL